MIFAWYLWPSRLVGFALVTAAALDISRRFSRTIERSTIWVGALAIAIMAAAEWTVAFHWGEREARFLTHIGYELRDAATPTDTLLLEPAGYISYFAGIHTDDEVGLVSRRVTAYRQRFGAAWWIHFVSDERPTFLVEREPMLTYRTTDGYRLSPSEQRWFERNYRLARTFAYNPLEHYQNRFLVRLLSTRPLPGNLYWYRHVDD